MTNCQPEFDVIEKKSFKNIFNIYIKPVTYERIFSCNGHRTRCWRATISLGQKPVKIYVRLIFKQTKYHVFLTKYVGTIITLQEDLHGGIYAMCI